MDSNNKYHWMNWIAKMLKYLRSGDLSRTANMLACCLPDEEYTDVDRTWAAKMFKHQSLTGKHAEIWELMKPMIVEECVDRVFTDMQAYGWPITL